MSFAYLFLSAIGLLFEEAVERSVGEEGGGRSRFYMSSE